MKTTDLAFAVTLSAMLLASLAAIGNVGLRTSPTMDEAMPVFHLEPVVITGTKGIARAAGIKKAQLDEVAVPCACLPEATQKRA
jgi:hypothetical protein